MIKFMLNLRKPNNYAFFCPISRLHLTVGSPVGFTNEVTPAILKALKAKTVLDVDGVVDIEMGTVKADKQTKKAAEVKAPEATTPVQKNEDNADSKQVDDAKVEAPAEEKAEAETKSKSKGGKKAAKADAE